MEHKLRVEDVRQSLVEVFPPELASEEVRDNSSPVDHDLNWCIDALLLVPWTELPLDTVVRNQECPIYLSDEQVLACLPAFLDATLVTIDDPDTGFFECLTFLNQALSDGRALTSLTTSSQRIAISDVLDLAAACLELLEEIEDSVTWRDRSFEWKALAGF